MTAECERLDEFSLQKIQRGACLYCEPMAFTPHPKATAYNSIACGVSSEHVIDALQFPHGSISITEALCTLKKAAAASQSPRSLLAKHELAVHVINQNDPDNGVSEAIELLQEVCAAGPNMVAEFNLGLLYEREHSHQKLAYQMYEIASRGGHREAMLNLGNLHDDSGDYDKAVALYLDSAKLGNPFAFWNLARMYQTGRGVALDEKKALVWLQKAAASGLPEANTYMPRCSVCDSVATELCAECGLTWYCSRACQLFHWPNHQESCQDSGTNSHHCGGGRGV